MCLVGLEKSQPGHEKHRTQFLQIIGPSHALSQNLSRIFPKPLRPSHAPPRRKSREGPEKILARKKQYKTLRLLPERIRILV